MDTVTFTDPFGRSLFFDHGWKQVTAQSVDDAWFAWPEVIHPNQQSSVFEQWVTGVHRRAPVDIKTKLAVGRKVRAVAQAVFLDDMYVGHVGLVCDVSHCPPVNKLSQYLKSRKYLADSTGAGEYKNLLVGDADEVDPQVVKERAQTVRLDTQKRLSGPHHRRSRKGPEQTVEAQSPETMVPVLLVSGAYVKEVYRYPNLDTAQAFVTEFNRREAMLPTGYIALVHPIYLLCLQQQAGDEAAGELIRGLKRKSAGNRT